MTPVTYSSPATSGGTGWRKASSTYVPELAIGRPIGTTSASGASGALIAAHTVVSVGPYALTMRRVPAQRAGRPGGHASPATVSVSSVAGSSSATASTLGGTVAWVMSQRRSAAPSATWGGSPSAPGTTEAAPDSRAMHSSETAASKLSDAICRTRDSRVTANRSIWARARFPTPVCGTTTPLGRPVEPDV